MIAVHPLALAGAGVLLLAVATPSRRVIPLPVRTTADAAPPPPVAPAAPARPPYAPPTALPADKPPRLLTARTASGLCWDVPVAYAGDATRQRPRPDTLTPACHSLGMTRGF